ncbi:MAG: P-II family nitrogen regulator [bacterium]|nr:P-II family nitrogen regulator [bacterium]
MKKIEAVIRPSKVGDVISILEKVGHPGLMISEVEGHGKQKGLEQKLRGKTYKMELINKAKIEIVTKDEDLDKIINAICEAAFTGKIGDGKIFIYPVEDVVRIRTREKGEKAL